eukprot:6512215-Lingulodinium_polyedra.AAC.1
MLGPTRPANRVRVARRVGRAATATMARGPPRGPTTPNGNGTLDAPLHRPRRTTLPAGPRRTARTWR